MDDKDFRASLVLCVLGVSSEVENVTAARALGFQGLCFNAKTAAPGALAEAQSELSEFRGILAGT